MAPATDSAIGAGAKGVTLAEQAAAPPAASSSTRTPPKQGCSSRRPRARSSRRTPRDAELGASPVVNPNYVAEIESTLRSLGYTGTVLTPGCHPMSRHRHRRGDASAGGRGERASSRCIRPRPSRSSRASGSGSAGTSGTPTRSRGSAGRSSSYPRTCPHPGSDLPRSTGRHPRDRARPRRVADLLRESVQGMGRGRVIGIDIEIRPHNRTAIEAHPWRR